MRVYGKKLLNKAYKSVHNKIDEIRREHAYKKYIYAIEL